MQFVPRRSVACLEPQRGIARGFDVDRKKLSEWSNWAVDDALKTTKPSERSGADALALILLGRRSENEPTADNDNQKVRSLLLDWQEPDGSWHAQKQFKGLRWTDVEMHEATTMWCLLALMQDDASDEPPSFVGNARCRFFAKNPKRKPSRQSRCRCCSRIDSATRDVSVQYPES